MKALSEIATTDIQDLLTGENLSYLHQIQFEKQEKQRKNKEAEKIQPVRRTEDMAEGNQLEIASNIAVDDDLRCDEEVKALKVGLSS